MLTGLFCLDSGYAWYHNWKRERCIDAVLEASYGDSDSGDKKKNFVDRPDAERLFGRIIVSDPGTYSVIVGSCGTGKSALAKEVARKTPGVIYVDVPPEKGDSKEVEGGLDSTLSVALNWREPVTPWRTVLLSKIVNVPRKRVLIFVFIVPRTDQFLPSRLTENRISQENERFPTGCRPLQGQASRLLRRPHY